MSEAPQERPLVFVIGDSIAMGYGPFLEQYLAPSFRYASKRGGQEAMRALGLPVHGNGGDSSQVLKYLVSNDVRDEIPATDYLLNCGLHDIRTAPASGATPALHDLADKSLRRATVAVDVNASLDQLGGVGAETSAAPLQPRVEQVPHRVAESCSDCSDEYDQVSYVYRLFILLTYGRYARDVQQQLGCLRSIHVTWMYYLTNHYAPSATSCR